MSTPTCTPAPASYSITPSHEDIDDMFNAMDTPSSPVAIQSPAPNPHKHKCTDGLPTTPNPFATPSVTLAVGQNMLEKVR
uniref:Uncharacterized protein n=1 Tax=Moniliophthora roreri TaxID=221103 RepID=A0A0W0GFT9_MONRR